MKFLVFSILLLFSVNSFTRGQQIQNFKFAFLTDTHINLKTSSIEDLRRSITDINADSTIKFVILTGDVTDFGTDAELSEAHNLLSKLRIPVYVIPGNHDANWSESGANSFNKIFGKETILFSYGGFLFLGTASGPNLRMGPGQVPREDLLWLDSTLQRHRGEPIVYLNHYPQDSSLNNWYEILDILKKNDIRIILHGHGHIDKVFEYEGIPAIMARSNLRANKDTGAYNIVDVNNDTMYFFDKTPFIHQGTYWAKIAVGKPIVKDSAKYSRPDYHINTTYKQVKERWRFDAKSDIGSGMRSNAGYVYLTTTKGYLIKLDITNGKPKWTFKTSGKIYTTPCISDKKLVLFGSTDGFFYAISGQSGKLKWKYKCNKAVMGNAVTKGDTCFFGASDGHFRAIDIRDGHLIWDYDQVQGFVVDEPLIYQGNIYFGSWGTYFYALNIQDGKLVWKWSNGSENRMYSPAACHPVGCRGKIYIVAPDRFMTCFDATTGTVVWRAKNDMYKVRESMGISEDSSLVLAKTMEGHLIGVSTTSDSMKISWISKLQLPYEIAPTALIAADNMIFVPSNSGLISTVNSYDGTVLWQHKISNCMITGVEYISPKTLLVSTMDGVLVLLKW